MSVPTGLNWWRCLSWSATGLLMLPLAASVPSTSGSSRVSSFSAGCPSLSGAGPVGAWSGEGSVAGSPGPSLSGLASYGSGVSGSAFVLSGSGLSSTDAATLTSAVSVMAWVKSSTAGVTQAVVSRSTGPGFRGGNDVSHGYSLRLGPRGDVSWEVDDPSSMVPEVVVAPLSSVVDGGWHHVAATWQPGSMAVFVDGVEVARQVSRSGSINPAASTPFMIGGEHSTPFGFTGLIDEVMLFNRAITAAEIAGCVPPQTIGTLAGTGTPGFSGDGGLATDATLRNPGGLAVDASGNLYFADSGNHRVRKVSPTGIISTVAGIGQYGFSGDGGPATNARLDTPWGVAVDASGNLYIADSYNQRIRRVSPAGIISTVAGNGAGGFSGDGGLATNANLKFPMWVAVDGSGNLFITDTNNQRIRKVSPSGTISTAAGTGNLGFSGDGGPATSANLNYPSGLAVDGSGNLFIADTNNERVRMVSPSGTISTVAGTGTRGFSGDGGPAVSARLSIPYGLAVDGLGNLFIVDGGNYRVRKVSPLGRISTIAGAGIPGFSGDGGAATDAAINPYSGVAVNALGWPYIADTGNSRIRRMAG
jgi:sugar lactone lactonase YvrE